MENKTSWLVQMEVGACLMAAAIVAFFLMLAHTLWEKELGSQIKHFPARKRITKVKTNMNTLEIKGDWNIAKGK